MSRFNHVRLLGAASMVAILVSNPAFAQQDGEDGFGGGGDIVVTARRVEERLQDVPISITAFNQDQLTARNIASVIDLAIYTPSLQAFDQLGGGGDNARFQIRGFTQVIDTAPSVGVYFNDVVAPRGGGGSIATGDGVGVGSFFDLQNAQVLKGPQGTLFGRNTTGGAILLVPQKPTDRFEGYAEGTVGNYDLVGFQAVINTPLGENARLRLGIDRKSRDGYLINRAPIGAKDFNDMNYVSLRGSLVVDLTPNLENYLVGTYSNSSINGSTAMLIDADCTGAGFSAGARRLGTLACDQQARQAGFGKYEFLRGDAEAYSRIRSWQFTNTTTWTASDNLTIKNILSYAQFSQHLYQEFSGTSFRPGALTGSTALDQYLVANNQVGSLNGGNVADQSTFVEELQFQGRIGDGKLTWQAGGYLELSDPLGPAGTQAPFRINCRDYATLDCTDSIGGGALNKFEYSSRFRNYALYAQATYALTDTFKVTGGFRYTWDEINIRAKREVYRFNPAPAFGVLGSPSCFSPLANAQCIENFRTTSSAPTWLIDLVYQPSRRFMAYAKYARGYRAGAIATTVAEPELTYVKPEKVDLYEVGIKTSFDGAVSGTFNVSAFYNDFSNQQLQVSFSPRDTTRSSSAGPINAGKSELYGAEVEASLRPFDGFNLQASYAWLKTRIKELPNFGNLPTGVFDVRPLFRVGDPNTFAPEHRLNVTAAYTLPLDESVGNITLAATYSYTSSLLANYNSRNSPSPKLRQYSTIRPVSLVNLNLNWNNVLDSNVDLSAFVTNLTNKYYYTYIAGVSAGAPFETASIGAPRMWGVRMRVSFGN
ncbi:MAG TPA: TonB-dependent receptor [Novosphingobium sp.]